MSLAERLRRRIRAFGPITLADYMSAALTDSEEGYYRRKDPLGAAGDFVTAPEVSQMFGELIGAWAAVAWEQMGRPDPVRLVELGPGRGTLMADALRATSRVSGFHQALKLHLVEVGEQLMERQRAALSQWQPTWHAELADVPSAVDRARERVPRHAPDPPAGAGREWMGGTPDRTRRRRSRLRLRANGAHPLLPPSLEDALPGTTVEISPARIAVVDLLARRLLSQGESPC